MDLFANNPLEDDPSDSWSFIDENTSEDGIDFEIIKDLLANNFKDANLLSSDEESDVDELIEENIQPNITTTENEANLQNENEEDVDVLVDFNPSNNSLKKFHISRDDIHRVDEEKNTLPKSKKKKKHFYKCPFVTGVSLGTILTVCGLSLILKSSKAKVNCPESQNVTNANLNQSLGDILQEQTIWSSILEEDKLLRKYCPSKFNKDWIKQKNLKSKLLKRIDRRVKQQMRDYEVKPLKIVKQHKNECIGPLNKNECPVQHNEENKTNSEHNFYKQRHFNDTFISQTNICPVKTTESNCSATSNDKKENSENYSGILDKNETENMQTSKENKKEILSMTDDNKHSEYIPDLEDSYEKLKSDIIDRNRINQNEEKSAEIQSEISYDSHAPSKNSEKNKCELNDLFDSSQHSIKDYINRIRQTKSTEKTLDIFSDHASFQKIKSYIQLLNEKSQNNEEKSSNQPQNNIKVPTDMVAVLENKISKIKVDNTRLTTLIKEQENFIQSVQTKLEYKRRILEKRLALQKTLEKHLQCIKNRRELRKNVLNLETGNISNKISELILQDFLINSIKNATQSHPDQKENVRNINKTDDSKSNMEITDKDETKNMKASLDIFLQKKIQELNRNMEDEEHIKQNNQFEKRDPRKTWTRKRNEFY